MIAFTNTILISRPVGEVYAYLADLEHTPEWNWAIDETKKTTPGPVTVGSRYRQRRSVPRPATEELEVTVLERNRRIEIVGTLAEFPAHLTYRFVESSTGTELTNTVVLEPTGPLRFLGSLARNRIKQSVSDNLGQLRSLLESRPTST